MEENGNDQKPKGDNSALIGAVFWVAIICFFLIANFRPWIQENPKLTISLGAGVLLIAFFLIWRVLVKRSSAQFQVLYIIVVALFPAVWVFLTKEVAIRYLFLVIVCLLPGLLFYLFVSARRYSMLNDHVTNLHQLGLLKDRQSETAEDTKRRISSYLQEFEALYGDLPPNWVEEFLTKKKRFLGKEDRETKTFVSIVATETMLPVLMATVLVVVGWLWTLPPWHIEETRKSWETFAEKVESSAEKREEQPPAALDRKIDPDSEGEGAKEAEGAASEEVAAPADGSEADPEAPASEEPAPAEEAAEAAPPSEETEAAAAIRPAGSPLYLLAVAGARATEPEAGQEQPEAPIEERKKVWYNPFTWFGAGDEGEPVAAGEGAAVEAPETEAVEPVAQGPAPPSEPEESEADRKRRYEDFKAALLPVRTPMAFAFLGAYFFSVQLLFRRFIRRDLGANAYISFAIRIVLAWLGTWVVVHALTVTEGYDPNNPGVFFLLAGFTVGVFPTVVWHVMQTATSTILGNFFEQFKVELPLSRLDGLNIWHQTRLVEEDIENIPSMSNTSIVDLLLRTRIPPNRIIDWVDQAILYTHLGPEKDNAENSPSAALRAHGILNASSLKTNYEKAKARGETDLAAFEKILPGADGSRSRIRSIYDAIFINPNLELITNWRKSVLTQP